VCAAFAASFLLRIARLFPHELNLKRTAKDVEELAGVLAEGESQAPDRPSSRSRLRQCLQADTPDLFG
jgi:hypothetical protein